MKSILMVCLLTYVITIIPLALLYNFIDVMIISKFNKKIHKDIIDIIILTPIINTIFAIVMLIYFLYKSYII